ncbi:MAG: arylesterase [Saprospiraceae bacterium]|nr:arylesterase [Saprospiraceae bacterium]
MNKLFLLSAILILFSACGSNNSESVDSGPLAKNPQPATGAAVPRRNIVFFGNSLTAAYQLSPEQGFTAIIQKKIDALGLPYRCVNAGLSGETTADGKNRIDWVLKQPVDIFVLELGGNDALRGLPVKASRENLQAIIGKVKARYPDCKIVLAGMLAPPNLGSAYTTAFKQMYPDLAQNNRATLIPFLLDGVGGVPALNLEDGIHPNVDGQKIVAENVWKVLKPLL